MQLPAYVQKIVDAIQASPQVGEEELPLLLAFARSIGRQLRAPFCTRTEPEGAATIIRHLWQSLQRKTGSLPEVHPAGDGRMFSWMIDQPFIVNTGRLVLDLAGVEYLGGFNAVVAVGRDEQGQIVRIADIRDRAESLVWIEVGVSDPQDLADLCHRMTNHLRIAQVVVSDFRPMSDLIESFTQRLDRQAAAAPDQADELREAAELLRWLLADNFVVMGVAAQDASLGTANASVGDIWDTEALRLWEAEGGVVSVRKGKAESPMHRTGRVNEIRIHLPGTFPGDSGRTLFIQGLFTFRALTQASRHVPQLRRILSSILAANEVRTGSYRWKGLANAFDSLPTEFLFTSDQGRISALLDQVLEAEQEQSARAELIPSRTGDTLFVIAAMPRARWSDRLREDMSRLLKARTGASYLDHGVYVGRFQTMLVHFYLTGTSELDAEAHAALKAEIAQMATPWIDQVWEVLVRQLGEDKANELIGRFQGAFGELTMQRTSAERAARDILQIEKLRKGSRIEVDLYAEPGAARPCLRIYQARDIILSDILPVLDDFGVRVVDQDADVVQPTGGVRYTIDTFRVAGVAGLAEAELLARGELLVDGLRAVFEEKMGRDPLNAVLLGAGIPWQAVDLLRAYNGYLRQLGLRLTIARTKELLLSQPALVRDIWELFQSRFDPDLSGDRDAMVKVISDRVDDQLRTVIDQDQDRLFRALVNLVESTLRTNFYRTDRSEHYISFKVAAAPIKIMQEPKLKYEIYVHHREVEGVHLRGSDIARGGIRWSDREDYRREILDLATTQMVKNVIIVPEGAKGGFYIRHNPGDRNEQKARADRLYQILIRGMLDVTDNHTPNGPVRPPRVVCKDGIDPYLVVAADKGTAHLSDTANRLSRAYGFWLDDAFASGGSNGYDHKKVGITARGGWMTVRRLMAEYGLDPRKDTFTCVGVGDTSGDVFGNGVIEHPTMKLVAAFNHLHVFIDPDPDPARTYTERKRLFDEVKGWEHYDRSLISEGGGIFNRRAKSIPLSPQIKKLLGVTQDELPVDTVLRLLLRLDVDLLWNGGIGTYVKASSETHADANDPTNDEVRVNANELRCKVVGEGGNLGFTQRARIEYALHGGRLNTDFIDNSGGVDMSDHEVNLKILLNPMVTTGRLSLDQRNVLLESLTDQVADDVLADNDRHARQISLDQIRSVRDPLMYSRTIDWACRRGGFTRGALRLPTDDDLRRRAAANQGLTRPELAVLQAHVKMHIFKDLRDADTSRVPGFTGKVRGYFPNAVTDQFPADVDAHMLHASIGMTVVTNEVIGESGTLIFPMISELSGAPAIEVARAWYLAMALIGEPLRAEVEAQANPGAVYTAWVEVTEAVQALVSIWLGAGEPGADQENGGRILEALQIIQSTPGSGHRARLEARSENLLRSDISASLAEKLASLSKVTTAREVALLTPSGDLAAAVVGYLGIGEASRIIPTIRKLEGRKAEGGWDPVAVGILRGRYIRLLRDLVRSIDLGEEAQLGVDRVASRLGRGRLAELRDLVDHILGENPSIAALLVCEERVRAWMAKNC